MTDKNWYELVVQEWNRFDFTVKFPTSPEDWAKEKAIILDHLRAMDTLTEMYFKQK